MGKRIEPKLRIKQKSIGFYEYQWDFFDKYPDFKPDSFCREAINKQIALINEEFLKEKDEKTE